MRNIIFIAPPAAGKGTQSKLLVDKYNYEHLSTGDLLREASSSGTEMGKDIKSIMDSGKLVSDDIIVNLIKEKLTSLDGKPFILDGFPRNLNQAKALEKIIDNNYEVIYLDLAEEEALKRVLGRLTCACGKSYNSMIEALKPKTDGVCDSCSRPLGKRDDDNHDAYVVRYRSFVDNTKPLIDYYDKKKILHKIDVNRDVNEIFTDVVKVANNHD